MPENLLSRIQRELHERMEELRAAIDEHDRLEADLRALDAGPRPAADNDRCEAPPWPPPVDRSPQQPSAYVAQSEVGTNIDGDVPSVDVAESGVGTNIDVAEPSTEQDDDACMPKRATSPLIFGVRDTPRQAGLESSSAAQMSENDEVFLVDPADEFDAEADLYERSI